MFQALCKPLAFPRLTGATLPGLQLASLLHRARGKADARSASFDASRLFDEHGQSVYRLAYSYLRNSQDAEDVLQDTLVQFMRATPKLNGPDHEKAWLLRVAANLSKNKLKARRADCTDELAEQLAQDEGDDLSFVWEAVGRLPEQQREVIHLFYHEGYSVKETARILERNESTVRSDLTRGRNNLKEMLKEAYDFD